MLLKLDEENEDYYLCSSSNWTTVVLAEHESQAAGRALTYVIDALGMDANVAASIRVKKIKEEVENDDNLFRMDEILSDIGMHKESKALTEIIKTIIEK